MVKFMEDRNGSWTAKARQASDREGGLPFLPGCVLVKRQWTRWKHTMGPCPAENRGVGRDRGCQEMASRALLVRTPVTP